MKIDITTLNEDEFIDLHRRITERLRFLSQTRAHHTMLEFKVGDRVTFKPGDRQAINGVLTKYNKKTVTVLADNGEHWNVSPGLLTLAKDNMNLTINNRMSCNCRREERSILRVS